MSEEKKDLTNIFELTEENEAPTQNPQEESTEAFTRTVSSDDRTQAFELTDLPSEPSEVTHAPEFSPPPLGDEVSQIQEDPNPPPMPEDVGPHEPFDLWVDGHLSPEEKAKLIELLETEKFGIRESDIELQLQGTRVRIPRISEYGGVLIVQALRGSKAVFRLLPSHDSHAPEPSASFSTHSETVQSSDKPVHPAENIPVVTSPTLSNSSSFVTIDMLTASASFSSHHLQPHASTEYQSLLEALQRELKYKAYRKKADAVVSFQVQLIPLTLPSEYKMVASGTAVKYTAS